MDDRRAMRYGPEGETPMDTAINQNRAWARSSTAERHTRMELLAMKLSLSHVCDHDMRREQNSADISYPHYLTDKSCRAIDEIGELAVRVHGRGVRMSTNLTVLIRCSFKPGQPNQEHVHTKKHSSFPHEQGIRT
nr:hypothetical protein CFP56_46704 [Quercus suber]